MAFPKVWSFPSIDLGTWYDLVKLCREMMPGAQSGRAGQLLP
jgi:hypothetical protein